MTKSIAAITTVRNDTFHLERWINYYSAQFGAKNLYVFLDGHDQPKPDAPEVNFIYLPHKPLKRVPAMKRRARTMSKLAQALFSYHDIVIASDVDEILVVDPKIETPLADYLSDKKGHKSLSGLGLDVGQKLDEERPLDASKPALSQRHYAEISSRYTKPVVAFRPLTWGSGLHRVKGSTFHIDPNLYLFHFGMADYELATGKTLDQTRLDTGWKGHLERREALFQTIAEVEPIDADDHFDELRKDQTRRRPLYALNKPAMPKTKTVVRIPQRFEGII